MADSVQEYLKTASIEDEGYLMTPSNTPVNKKLIDQINNDPLGDTYSEHPLIEPQPKHRGPQRPDLLTEFTPSEAFHIIDNDFYGDNEEGIPEQHRNRAVFSDMRDLAGNYCYDVDDPLFQFASRGIIPNLQQRDEILNKLKEEREYFSSHTKEYQELTSLLNYIHSLIPIYFTTPGGNVIHKNFDYLTNVWVDFKPTQRPNIQEFIIAVNGSMFEDFLGSIVGTLENGRVHSWSYNLHPMTHENKVDVPITTDDVQKIINTFSYPWQ